MCQRDTFLLARGCNRFRETQDDSFLMIAYAVTAVVVVNVQKFRGILRYRMKRIEGSRCFLLLVANVFLFFSGILPLAFVQDNT